MLNPECPPRWWPFPISAVSAVFDVMVFCDVIDWRLVVFGLECAVLGMDGNSFFCSDFIHSYGFWSSNSIGLLSSFLICLGRFFGLFVKFSANHSLIFSNSCFLLPGGSQFCHYPICGNLLSKPSTPSCWRNSIGVFVPANVCLGQFHITVLICLLNTSFQSRISATFASGREVSLDLRLQP